MSKKRKNPETPSCLVRRLVQEAESLPRVAREAGVDRPNLYRFRDGRAGISTATLDRLAEYFGLVLR